ncbi:MULTISPECIES: CoA-binding protein [unclassified Nostoc]|uniref:CoA-binding protein n=1 Tax=unclassified Nostoc TaxID=2593658 RepID=UPI002AD5826B|nr:MULTISPECIES: CoA-binding protein [unclassified Nostoc]MDZ8121483.1 CoA-binding protein [Nostoc sp. CmiVER01]MDZ8222489.1 CoA-binding protein [Nostoc sp. ChiVER01]
MPNLKEDDNLLLKVLTQAKTIAVVGYSDKRHRTSYQIAQFLRQVGYKVYAVNPLIKEIDGQSSYAALQELPEPVDIVNVFRRSEYLPAIVDKAISINVKTVWAQLGIWDQSSAQKATEAGLNVVMDTCIKIEYLRLRVDSARKV